MHLAMQRSEIDLLTAFLKHSNSYFEFGSGGSTVLASQLVKSRVVTVDSSTEWIEKVSAACVNKGASVEAKHVNIGPTKEWGYPDGSEHQALWRNYSESAQSDADFYLIDGRFRVSCFMKTILRCPHFSFIAVHDFHSRDRYHAIRQVAREVARADELSIFVKDHSYDARQAAKFATEYELNPD